MIKGGFCLVETLFDVHCELPVDIGDGIRIQRPSAAQSEIISAIDDDALAFFISRIDLKRFTHDNVEVSESAASAKSWKSVLLPKSKQRFLVISFTGQEGRIHAFEMLAGLMTPALRFMLYVYTSEPAGEGLKQGSMFVGSASTKPSWVPEVISKLTPEYVSELKRLWLRWNEVTPTYGWIVQAASMLHDLRTVPKHQPLHLLGLFAVLELLVTHNPHGKDNHDSISHQLRTKMPLCFARMPLPPDSSVFANLPTSKLWDSLYALRSLIAHGGIPDYSKGKFLALNSQDQALDFLEDAVRKLAVLAINEPRLIQDLKAV